MDAGRQSGMTLLEIMLSLAVGSIVIGGAATIYVSTVSSTSEMLRSSKLNQELAALMNVTTNDVRRAGYWGNMDPDDYARPQDNPFSQPDETALEVHAGNVEQGPTGVGECIVYTYDADNDGVLDDGDIRGFRLAGGAVQMRERGLAANATHDSCDDSDDVWRDVTDTGVITVDALTFDLSGSSCLNTSEPDGEDDDGDGDVDNDEERDCYALAPAAGSDDISLETREVTITITGSLTADPAVTITLSQDVRVRNDLVQIH